MQKQTLLKLVGAIAALVLIAAGAWLTQYQEDPCNQAQGDISAAILADNPDDADALANRAILMRGACKDED